MLEHEPGRLDLLRGLEQVLGEQRAATLMTYLPSTVDVASQEDVRRLERRLDERFSVLIARMDACFEQMDRRFEQIDSRFEQVDRRFEQMDKRIDERFDEMNKLMQDRTHAVLEMLDARYDAVGAQIRGGDDGTAATLRQEFNRLLINQTRILLFMFLVMIATNLFLALVAR